MMTGSLAAPVKEGCGKSPSPDNQIQHQSTSIHLPTSHHIANPLYLDLYQLHQSHLVAVWQSTMDNQRQCQWVTFGSSSERAGRGAIAPLAESVLAQCQFAKFGIH